MRNIFRLLFSERDAPFKVVEFPKFVKELKNVEIAIEEWDYLSFFFPFF